MTSLAKEPSELAVESRLRDSLLQAIDEYERHKSRDWFTEAQRSATEAIMYGTAITALKGKTHG